MVGDEGPYMAMDEPLIYVPRTVPWKDARKVALGVVDYGDRLRYNGKVTAALLGFTRDCRCDEVCELRYKDGEDTDDRTCYVPAWEFEVIE